MPVLVEMNMSFGTYCAFFMLPDWGPVMNLPIPERIERLRDPAVRAHLLERSQSSDAGVFTRLTEWGRYQIGDTYSDANRGLKGRLVADIAQERKQAPFDALLDIVIADDLRTVLWPLPTDDDADSWRLRAEAWALPDVLLGGSDAGAHLDRMCGAPYPTQFLADSIRGKKLVTLERAVQLLTQAPAGLFGLRDRGELREGAHADIVLFDPDTVAAGDATLISDLPGGTPRLDAPALGIERVLVNGRAVVANGALTGDLPGGVLRSGSRHRHGPCPSRPLIPSLGFAATRRTHEGLQAADRGGVGSRLQRCVRRREPCDRGSHQHRSGGERR